ncbi:uncharacterized protein Dwil_GK27736 [Drosophila willistoni]|uniref:Uncharacterized protein n=1 Tax=Drosophila willistoni TaxID=7260 RepID=A0A0Q9WZU3_DROWI|nr:uncharacterized protein Dwil_GK27736 [Drosophila willistoni]
MGIGFKKEIGSSILEAKRQREKTCRRSQRDQELLCEFVRKSSTCAA